MPPNACWWFCPREPADCWKAKDVRVITYSGQELIAHWACNLSGEEQPPFRGWFTASGQGFKQIHPEFWRRL